MLSRLKHTDGNKEAIIYVRELILLSFVFGSFFKSLIIFFVVGKLSLIVIWFFLLLFLGYVIYYKYKGVVQKVSENS
jgi:hypothetical protein